mmetsp:Transcript_69527/g.197020  ORF Transcript_69527/g.197020 Transcript_69527/m.197020 type:complete len:529 (-) Transcript_69527:111-1697(-)
MEPRVGALLVAVLLATSTLAHDHACGESMQQCLVGDRPGKHRFSGDELTMLQTSKPDAMLQRAVAPQPEGAGLASVPAAAETELPSRAGVVEGAAAAHLKTSLDETAVRKDEKKPGKIPEKKAEEQKVGEQEVAVSSEWACVWPDEVKARAQESMKELARGFPVWQEALEVPKSIPDATIAFLIQVAWKDQLPVMRRAFDILHNPRDIFLYSVDKERLDVDKVLVALPTPLPGNVHVHTTPHADYYLWPRVEIVLDGLRRLLKEQKYWDFAIHLSESDYPLHSVAWIRSALSQQRRSNFVQVFPRCRTSSGGSSLDWDTWFWWGQNRAVATCDKDAKAQVLKGVSFPMEAMEAAGVRFARGVEWMAITRELVRYALSPQLLHYRKLVGLHLGADEIFWQTLVLNIPLFGQGVSKQGWFLRWGHGKTDHSPDTLNDAYQAEIVRTRDMNFFMRKVGHESVQLLDTVDNLIQKEVETHAPPVVPDPNEEWSRGVVACPRVRQFEDQPSTWQGTKSRQQLEDAYKSYMYQQ